MTDTIPLPTDWAAQIHEAFIEVQKHALVVGGVVLPWQWRRGWEALERNQTDTRLFGVPASFAMVDRPVALIKH